MPLRFLVPVAFLLFLHQPSAGDPQTKLLNLGCSTYNATNSALFLTDLNATFTELRSNVSSAENTLTVTSEQPRSSTPIYALFFCRDYLSRADCLACLSAAVSRVHSCGNGTGGRAIYDGCTLRYESAPFFEQGSLPGNTAVCANGTSAARFADAVKALAQDLSLAVPRIAEFSAAAERDGVYAAAQCAQTLSQAVCSQCLEVAFTNIQGCLPAGEGRAVDAGCFMRYSDAAFFDANQTVDLALILRGSGGSTKKRGVIGGVLGGIGGMLILSLGALLWIKHSRRREDHWKGDILGATELQGPVKYKYSDLKSATKGFSQDHKLGEGGFGEVYKGILKNGNTVAVKRLSIAQTESAKASFQSEVKLISNVHHRNLVRLLGCCSKNAELLLVYEYMANGSLDRFLFGESGSSLTWKQRFDIIVGTAKGIAYLHHEFHVCIIHRDIKPSNVLLDDNFQPKIADFGLVRLMPGDQSHLSTKFAGTLGYTAPEYAIHGQLTEKVDTYSFGVVILEIISGRRNSYPKLEHQYLLEWVWKLYEEDDLVSLIDKSLDPEEYNLEEVKRVIKIALLCTQSMVATRPTMAEVVVLLLSQGEPQLEPARPIFIDAMSRVRGDTSSSAWSSSATQATISITQFSAR
ncbi:hypothetical protein HPP92_022523 [Vanilla planifolia]|uniref:Cysteine-rich receptor-like protein kinase 2 n=1 Tax=Vanilla planifolia TaxID=51239 RepID=A0A835PS58_VANPL|nr:hypothetical protein HPP92_022523 [Vanilla planifolia]